MNMKYDKKLFIFSCIPIVVFAIISLAIGFTQFRSSLYHEKEGYLRAAALAAQILYSSQGYGDFGKKVDGNVWRGMNFNVSTETSLVDDLKRQTTVDITFFFGDMPVMTSVLDENGNRTVQTNAIEYIKKHTLQDGSQLWCQSVEINGKRCQAYIIPVKQYSNNEVAGALMASQSKEKCDADIRNYIVTTVVVMLAVLLAVFVFVRWYVTRFSQEFYEVTDKSKRDLLTGLYNKRSFEEETKHAIANKRTNDVSVLLILDFDNFKHVNDNYGHKIGDEVLKAFGMILMRVFRRKDIIGRVGGDEFMVFMPDMEEKSLKRVDEISQEILNELKNLRVGSAGPFSCSIGIGTDATDYDFNSLYQLADKALYESKSLGKACYVRFSSAEQKKD